MKKNIFIWQIVGLTFTAILGTILHFLFSWTNNSPFIASFSAVNESTWEHMKLVFVPSFIFAIVQSFFLKKEYDNFWLIKLIGIFIGTFLIPIFFYTLTGSFGKLSAFINILIFFVSVIIEYLIELYLFNSLEASKRVDLVLILTLIFFMILFIVFTFYPPKLPMFLDPLTKTYGIAKR